MQLISHPDNEHYYDNALKAHQFLAYYWQHRLERPLKSFQVLFQLFD